VSDERNDAGQFTAPEEQSYGLPGIESEAGYVPMNPGHDLEPEEFADAREATDAMLEQQQAETEAMVYYNKDTGERLNDDIREGAVHTVTLNQAADDLLTYESAVVDGRAASISQDFAAEVDDLRARYLKENPDAANDLGIDPPKPEAVPNNNKSANEGAQLTPDGLDPEVAKALEHPQVRQAIEEQIGEATKVREGYSQAINTADAMTRATFMSEIPELSGLEPAQFEQGLAMLQQVDPPRFQKAMNLLGRFHQIQTAQQQHHQYQAHVERQNFERQAIKEDARLEAMIANEDPARVKAVKAEVPAYFTEVLGLDRNTLRNLYHNPVFRSAEAQRMLFDAISYRVMMKGPKAVAARSLPTVQRPGVAQPRMAPGTADLQRASAAFDRDPSVKNAGRLMEARSRAKG
jgi:hypothetical protein